MNLHKSCSTTECVQTPRMINKKPNCWIVLLKDGKPSSKYSTICGTSFTGWRKLDSQRGVVSYFRATSYQLGTVKHSIKVSMAAPYNLRANSLPSTYPTSAGSVRMASNIHSVPRNQEAGHPEPWVSLKGCCTILSILFLFCFCLFYSDHLVYLFKKSNIFRLQRVVN